MRRWHQGLPDCRQATHPSTASGRSATRTWSRCVHEAAIAVTIRAYPVTAMAARVFVPAAVVAALMGAGAAQAAPVVDGKARFTVITPSLIRLEYAADGSFENGRTQ